MRGLLYTFGYCGLLLATVLLSPFSRKLRRGLLGRVGLTRRVRAHTAGWQAPLWFHVASSGELEQCLPILDAIKERSPQKKIFLSVFSPSGHEGAQREKERRANAGIPVPWDYVDYCPFDLAFFLHPFFRAMKPEKLICIQREIWPNLVTTAKARGVTCFLFGSYFSPEGRKAFPLYQPWIRLFDFIGTVDDETTAFLVLELHSDHVQTLGDPRVERVKKRQQLAPSRPAFLGFFEAKPVFVAGSIWEADLKALLPTLQHLAAHDWRLIVVPHETRKAPRLQAQLKSAGLPSRLWSHWQYAPDSDSHLVVDEIGILAELYQVARLSFVGGSFKNRVHNVLEPAAYGVAVLTGPHIQNSAEALKMRQLGALKSSADAHSLLGEVRLLTADTRALEAQQKAIASFFDFTEPIASKYAELAIDG